MVDLCCGGGTFARGVRYYCDRGIRNTCGNWNRRLAQVENSELLAYVTFIFRVFRIAESVRSSAKITTYFVDLAIYIYIHTLPCNIYIYSYYSYDIYICMLKLHIFCHLIIAVLITNHNVSNHNQLN